MTAALLALLLSQPLNLNAQPIKSLACDGGLVCSVSGSRATIINTASGGGGGGGVTSVTASPPLASSGGATPNISLTGTVAGARGGLGAAQPVCGGGQFLTCDGTTCTCGTPSGGGGGAPVDAGYVVWGTATSGSTNERVLTAGTNITLSNGTPGQIIVNATGGGGGWAPDGGTARLVTTTGYTGTGTGTTAVPMPVLTYDAGIIGARFTYRCRLLTAVDGGTGTGIRVTTDFLGMTATSVQTGSMRYCSSATAFDVIGGGTTATINFAPTASQGNTPCEYEFVRHINGVTAIGQVRVFLYSELAAPNQVTALPGSYCIVDHW